jgi:hypothetical protein
MCSAYRKIGSCAPKWQRACEFLLAEADVAAFSKQVELALFYAAKPDVVRMQRAIDN